MNDPKINAAFGEALLRLAVVENHKREMDAIPPRKELARMYRFSPEHEARMKTLLANRQRKRLPKTALLRKIAATVIIAFALLFGLLLTNVEVRAAVWNVVVEWYGEYTRFAFPSGDAEAEDVAWYPSYVPEGFVEVGYEVLGGITIIDYSDLSGNAIEFNFSKSARSISLDNEHSAYSTIGEEGIGYHIYSAYLDEYPSTILWEQDGYSFYLQSMIPVEELLEMAYSVE